MLIRNNHTFIQETEQEKLFRHLKRLPVREVLKNFSENTSTLNVTYAYYLYENGWTMAEYEQWIRNEYAQHGILTPS